MTLVTSLGSYNVNEYHSKFMIIAFVMDGAFGCMAEFVLWIYIVDRSRYLVSTFLSSLQKTNLIHANYSIVQFHCNEEWPMSGFQNIGEDTKNCRRIALHQPKRRIFYKMTSKTFSEENRYRN